MDCKIIYTGDNRTGVIGLDGSPSETFQEILNNGQVKDFDEALEIYKGLYSDKIELPKAKVQNSGFFSNAEQSLLNLKDKNVKNVQGWVKALTDVQKNGGIKNVNQELEWIGLEDYLNNYVKENNPKAGNIPFSVVEDYIKSNQIEIVDVTKTTNKPRITEEDIIDAYEYNGDNGWVIRVDFEDGAYVDVTSEETEDIEEAKKIAVSEYNLSIPVLNTKGDTKYSGYQLKGAENYREILLTMPSTADTKESKEHMDYIKFLEDKYNTDLDMMGGRDELSKDELEKLKQLAEANYDSKKDKIQNEYSSSHWSEKNILAHVRLNEKTLPDGRRVLIANEIQADISQDLKKEQDKILDRVDKEFDNFLDNLIMNKVIIEEC